MVEDGELEGRLGDLTSTDWNTNSVDLIVDSGPQVPHVLYWNVSITEFRGLLGRSQKILLLAWYLQIRSAQ